MITQIGEKEAIFDFYMDILTYDKEENETFMSKEVYAKKVSSFFSEVPKECTEEEFVRAVWSASIDDSIPKEKQNPTLTLGYVRSDGSVTLFGSRMMKDRISLSKKDKILVFTNH
ncbi:MAG: hypothetical protein J5865_03030, partial [Lachnospiraceae bacterium]|nr:hypothetical protein [Lachnospiraceae bacterium]